MNPIIQEAIELKKEFFEVNLTKALNRMEHDILAAAEKGKTKLIYDFLSEQKVPEAIMIMTETEGFLMKVREYFELDEKQVNYSFHPITKKLSQFKIDWSDVDA